MAARRPTGGVGSNQYQTVGTPTVRAVSDRVAVFGENLGPVGEAVGSKPKRERVERSKCGECGKSVPTEQTALVIGRRRGDFRRGKSRSRRRVCHGCVVRHVEYTRRAQNEGRGTSLDSTYIPYSTAARELGVFVDDLWVNDYDLRTGWAERRAAIPPEALAGLVTGDGSVSDAPFPP